MHKLIEIFNKLARISEKRVDYFGARYIAFGVFCLVNYFFPIYMWSEKHSGEIAVYSIRVIAIILSFLLTTSDMWLEKYKKYRPLFWHFTVMFCLPFYVTFMIWYEGLSLIWAINASLAILTGLILLDLKSFFHIYILGAILGATTALILGHHLVLLLSEYTLYPSLYMFLFTFFIVILFSRDVEKKRNLQLNAMRALASTVAHEVRTPLSTISVLVKSMKIDKNITFEQIDKFNKKKELIINEMGEIFSLIDSMLMKVSFFTEGCKDLEEVSVKDLINDIMGKYILSPHDKKLIHIKIKEDFNIKVNRVLMYHVFFNLIQNALYQIKEEMKGEIFITANRTRKRDYISIKDTATGIAPERVNRIFEPFVTYKSQGTGLGLSFCKTVLESFGANIECESVYRQYAEFIIKF